MSERIKVVIVDDEPIACRRINRMVGESPDIAVVSICNDANSGIQAIRAHKPDLLFLDVQMPDKNGFEMIRELEPESVPHIVFVTAYDAYALQAFEVHAIDYLLKPFNSDRVRDTLSRARELIRLSRLGGSHSQLVELIQNIHKPRSYLHRIPVKGDGKVIFISVENIDWMECEGKYVRIYAGKQDYLIRHGIRALASELDPAMFARIHRKTIINMNRVRELQTLFHGEYRIVMHDGKALKLTRKFRPELKKLFGDY